MIGSILPTARHNCGKVIMGLYKTYPRSAGIEIGTGGMVSLCASVDVGPYKVIIRDNVTITAGCYILSHSAIETDIHPHKEPRTTTIINDGVFIGVNSVILPGVEIGKMR
jgi:acetyltransferase-like isoleucine patch superfamily enzyme